MQTGRLMTGGALVLALAVPCGVWAQETVSLVDGRTRLIFSAGLLNGESGEFVYDAHGEDYGTPGHKVSELIWRLDNVALVGIGLRHKLSERLSLNLDYWSDAGDGDGSMDDYDWLQVGRDWTHWSHHDNTTVLDVSRLDVSGSAVVTRFAGGDAALYALLGYRRDRLAWQAKGGYGIYSVDGYRDTHFPFPDVPGISYAQTWRTPYVGLGVRHDGRAGGRRVSFDGRLRFSDWVEGEGSDTHHLRSLHFLDEGEDGRWVALDLALDVPIGKQLDLRLAYSAMEYSEVKATTRMTDLITGSRTHFSGDAAGLSHRSDTISVGLGYRF